ncbi:hypothetical protein QYM36_013227 [Artemia franciscana]|uniref:Uncharacterized protein n=1 Tax=Artemia franciscana TaxID=6661 RepID=A0AA88HCH8_ARTSF|nr:hypothetical protein QYM36_013227 [Artemia franciscana]
MIQQLQNSHVKQKCFNESDQKWGSVEKLKHIFDKKEAANPSVDAAAPDQKFEGRENRTGAPVQNKMRNSTQITKNCSTGNVIEALPGGKILQTFEKNARGKTNPETKLINREKINRSIKAEKKIGCYNTYEEEATVDEISKTLTRKFEEIEGRKRNAETNVPDPEKTDCTINVKHKMIQKLQKSHMKQKCFNESDRKWASVEKLKHIFDNKEAANPSVDAAAPDQKFEGRENGTGAPVQNKIRNSTQMTKNCSTGNVIEALPGGKILQTFEKNAREKTNPETKLINREKINRSIKAEKKIGGYNTYEEEATIDEISEGKCSNEEKNKDKDRCKMCQQKLETFDTQDDCCEIYKIQEQICHYLSKHNISKRNQLDIAQILETLSSELDVIDRDKIIAIDNILETIQLQISRLAGLYLLENDPICLERLKMLYHLDQQIRQEKSELSEKSSLKDRLRSLMSKKRISNFQLWSPFSVAKAHTDKDLDIQNMQEVWSYRWSRESLKESTFEKIWNLEKTLENISNKLDKIESIKENAIETLLKSIMIRELRLAAIYVINRDKNYLQEIHRLLNLDKKISQLRENTKCQRKWDNGALEKVVTSLTNSVAI